VYTPSAAAPAASSPAYAPPPVFAQPGFFPNSGFVPNTGFVPNSGFVPNTGFWSGSPVYAQPPSSFMGGPLGALFGRVNIGQIVELVGQGFAAFKSLPVSPAATGDVSTDVQNFVIYQQALAEHGKLDEQIRTGASIIARLLGA
jgi:hypothetical protein